MAFALSVVSASALVSPPCSNQDCEKTYPVYPYPTKLVYRTHISAEHTVYIVTTVKVGVTDSLGINGGYLTYKGLSSGSPYGGAYVIGPNGTYADLRNSSGVPTYLTSTRDSSGSGTYQLWDNVAKWFNVSNVWATVSAWGAILAKLLF